MSLPIKRTLLLAAALLSLAATAQARVHRGRVSKLPVPRLIAAGNLPGCLSGDLTDPAPLMKHFKATVLRVIVSSALPGRREYGANGEALPCISAAQAEGYRVMLVVEWNSLWSPQRVRQFFSGVLQIYGPYLWAVGVGNEEEITPRISGPGYARDWRAVEPLIKQMLPHVIRAGGEISPWGLPFLKAALKAGLPGMQALAVHTYRYKWAFTMPQILQLAAQYRAPLWCDEGLNDGPDSWRPKYPRGGSDLPLSAMRGAILVGVWDRGGETPSTGSQSTGSGGGTIGP